MGTNFYLKKEAKAPCECCGRPFESEALHIGKSSVGWCFSLHVIPEIGINTLGDWVAKWYEPGWFIEDEYGVQQSVAEMLNRVAGRGRTQRHPVDGSHCIGNGSGSWDYITGEFS